MLPEDFAQNIRNHPCSSTATRTAFGYLVLSSQVNFLTTAILR